MVLDGIKTPAVSGRDAKTDQRFVCVERMMYVFPPSTLSPCLAMIENRADEPSGIFPASYTNPSRHVSPDGTGSRMCASRMSVMR